MSLCELQVSCPTLACIQFEDNYNTPQYSVGDNKFYHLHNLKELILTIPNVSASYVEFIANHPPDFVENLCITLKEISLIDWIKEVDMENIIRQAERMSKLTSAGIECTPDKEYEPEYKDEETSDMDTYIFQSLE